ncbi:Zinc finger protein 235 [Araneus ventricosus]|uniref:Zinc finger protein 235 n=1 Tax=Araneus ventricosus TaxID=182803 RepID=A0A4Y2W6B4_ARAVE|nr:Zinc finger protein 235 [Araneus ventricosus]
MFPFNCHKCSRKSIPAGRPHCLHCGSDPATDIGMGDKFHPTQPEIATSRVADVASGSINNVVPNDMKTGSTVLVHNRKRNESNNGLITEIQARKQCRQEICGISDKILSPYCKPGIRNPDFMPETKAARFHLENDNSHSIVIDHGFLNAEESQSHNPGMQEIGNLGKMRHLIVSQNIASNISILQSSQNNNVPGKISDSGVSIVKRLHSIDDILVDPGPSNFRANENMPDLLGEEFQSGNPFEIQSVVLRDEKTFTCRVCDEKIDKHTKIQEEKYIYFCCICTYTSSRKGVLQMHSDIHCPKNICNLCSKEYTEGDSHESEHTCNMCEKKFQCKTLLHHHSADHEEYFLTHCWGCSRNIKDHFIEEEGKKIYVCCVCGYDSEFKYCLQLHNSIHRPKFLCKICREEYPIQEKGLHDNEYACAVCEKKFQCKTLLGDHSIEHKNYFHTYCRVCNREILYDHKNENEEKPFFKCCQCLETFSDKCYLLNHLYKHTDVGLFKCDVCGRRFVRKRSLQAHSGSCIALSHKCEICRARFPRSDSLDAHRMEKHRQPRE